MLKNRDGLLLRCCWPRLCFAAYAGSRTQIWMVSNLAIFVFYFKFTEENLSLGAAGTIVWAQLHGSWPAGIALIGWWALFREKIFVKSLF